MHCARSVLLFLSHSIKISIVTMSFAPLKDSTAQRILLESPDPSIIVPGSHHLCFRLVSTHYLLLLRRFEKRRRAVCEHRYRYWRVEAEYRTRDWRRSRHCNKQFTLCFLNIAIRQIISRLFKTSSTFAMQLALVRFAMNGTVELGHSINDKFVF